MDPLEQMLSTVAAPNFDGDPDVEKQAMARMHGGEQPAAQVGDGLVARGGQHALQVFEGDVLPLEALEEDRADGGRRGLAQGARRGDVPLHQQVHQAPREIPRRALEAPVAPPPLEDHGQGDHGGDRIAGLSNVVEAGHDAARQLRLGHELDRHLGDHGQHAFAAHQHRHQVQARHVQRLGAELDGLALDGEAAHAQHVVQRQPVLQAVHAAGVLGHVAADRAGDLAGGVGREVQSVFGDRLRNPQVRYSRLCLELSIGNVDLQYCGHSFQRNDHPAQSWHCSAAQARARPARRERNLVGHAPADDSLYLLRTFWQDDHGRRGSVDSVSVAIVGAPHVATRYHKIGRQEGA